MTPCWGATVGHAGGSGAHGGAPLQPALTVQCTCHKNAIKSSLASSPLNVLDSELFGIEILTDSTLGKKMDEVPLKGWIKEAKERIK